MGFWNNLKQCLGIYEDTKQEDIILSQDQQKAEEQYLEKLYETLNNKKYTVEDIMDDLSKVKRDKNSPYHTEEKAHRVIRKSIGVKRDTENRIELLEKYVRGLEDSKKDWKYKSITENSNNSIRPFN